MPSYSFAKGAVTGMVRQDPYDGFVSVRVYAESASVPITMPQFVVCSALTPVAGTDATSEKLNSRSSSPTANDCHYNFNTSVTAWAYILSVSFSHSSYFPSFRPCPVDLRRGNVALIDNNVTSTTFDSNIVQLYGTYIAPRLVGKRTTKAGYSIRYGGDIGLHKKTGGGAFEMICPHFDNDITWVDPSAWRNGSAQSDAWSMQLYGAPAVPDPIGKEFVFQQAVQRAATW